MAIINSSKYLHGASPSGASLDIGLLLVGDLTAIADDPNINSTLDGTLRLNGELNGIAFDLNVVSTLDAVLQLNADLIAAAFTPGEDTLFLGLSLAGDLEATSELVLTPPAPITPTVALDAFTNQIYASGGGRLFINNVLTPFVSAEINAPAGSLGVSLSIQLASANRAQLPANATFKFQLGKLVNEIPVWTTILDGGKLAGSQFQMAVGRDSLSFSTFETDSKLNRYPKNNLIVFDAAKANVSADEIEPLPTNTGEFITTNARAVNVLTLKKLLDIAFCEGCGFSSVNTDIPNYEIARCDFSVFASWHDAIKRFIGSFVPVMSVSGNTLTIQKTVDPLPPTFTPNQITAARYPSFSENLQNFDSMLDGYDLSYTATSGGYFVDRNLPAVDDESGTFGEADFRAITINRKVRDWFETGNPLAVRSELKQEIRESRRNGMLIDREVKINTFDKLGRATGYTNTIEKRLPDIANNAVPALLKTSENSQKISYGSNPFNPRQTVQSKIETSSKALLAIDSENTALDMNGEDAPFGRDYEQVYEAGNLTKQMTSAFQTLSTTTEYFRPQANGQIECRTETFDAVRGIVKSPGTEIRSGDISVQNFTKQKTKTIFRAGVSQATRTGRIDPLNVGELPLFFAEPLANWLLANPRITASIELTGFDESVERGVSFNLRGRNNEDFGNFITRGYRISIAPNSIKTTIDALKV